MTSEKKQILVAVTLTREDLESLGFDVRKVDDDMMKTLAQKMWKSYMDNVYWNDLETLAGCLDFPTIQECDVCQDRADNECPYCGRYLCDGCAEWTSVVEHDTETGQDTGTETVCARCAEE